MRVDEIRHIARNHGVKVSGLKKPDLIRQIQVQEGNVACFGTAYDGICDQEGCLWRKDCFAEAKRGVQ